nr:hypothetical protein [Tanacetum cinerariifolium]
MLNFKFGSGCGSWSKLVLALVGISLRVQTGVRVRVGVCAMFRFRSMVLRSYVVERSLSFKLRLRDWLR